MADVRMEHDDGYGEVKAENTSRLVMRHPEKTWTRACGGSEGPSPCRPDGPDGLSTTPGLNG